MRGPALLALGAAALLAVLALPASAHTAANSFHVRADDEGGQYWFSFEGTPGRNPSLVLQPDTTYTFEVVNAGSMDHDFRIGGTQVVRLLKPGESLTGTFTTGADGTLEYSCAPHHALGMKGRMTVGTGKDNGTPAPMLAVPLALLAAAAILHRRRSPAA